jgi:hypothetical protein
LLTLALETLHAYPRQNALIETRTMDRDVQDVLEKYGFVEIETSHRLGAKLD